MSFVNEFLFIHKDLESPTSFWRWAAYTCIGAILRDNVFYDGGAFKVYPNIYTVLLADSAESRKSVPLNKVNDLMLEIRNTKIISGRSSIQAVLEDLGTTEMDRKTGHPIKGGSCLLIAGELSAFFVDDPQSIKIMTDIYDFKKEYAVSLKSGRCKITNVCLSMLAASNETLLKEVYNNKAVYGGLLGRTFFIKPDEFRPGNSLMGKGIQQYDLSSLVQTLHKIKNLRGTITISNEACDIYDSWYKALRESYRTKKDKTGILGRIHMGVLKVAMIIAVADHLELEIKPCCMNQAIDECSKLLKNYEEYATGMGQSNIAQIGSTFLAELWNSKNKTISRKSFLMAHWADFSSKDFDELLVTLEQAGMIQTVVDGNECAYKMTIKCTKVFNNEDKTSTNT